MRKYTVTPWLMAVGILIAATLSPQAQIMTQGGGWRHQLKISMEGQTLSLSSAKTFDSKKGCEDWAAQTEVQEQLEALMLQARAVDTEASLVAACVQKGQDT